MVEVPYVAETAFEKGYLDVSLVGQQADLVWTVMQTADCTPEEALGYLLSIARGEWASGAWDGSTVSQAATEGILVRATNLEDIPNFTVGQLVVAEAGNVDGRPQVIGKIKEMGPVWALLELTAGTKARMNQTDEGLYSVRLANLQEL